MSISTYYVNTDLDDLKIFLFQIDQELQIEDDAWTRELLDEQRKELEVRLSRKGVDVSKLYAAWR